MLAEVDVRCDAANQRRQGRLGEATMAQNRRLGHAVQRQRGLSAYVGSSCWTTETAGRASGQRQCR